MKQLDVLDEMSLTDAQLTRPTGRSISRRDIIAVAPNTDLPGWAARMLNGRPPSEIMVAVDELVSRGLALADIGHSGVKGRLRRLARVLGAEIIFLREREWKGYEPSVTGIDRGPVSWQRGLLRRSGSGWQILVGTRYEPRTRLDVAHEIAHALLYSNEDSVDLDAWQESTWSAIEEAVCNYIARHLLIPQDLLVSEPSSDDNVAMQIVRVAGLVKVPLRDAALRILDEMQTANGAIVLCWKQYHPFDQRFIDVAQRRFPHVCTEVDLRIKSIDASFKEAMQVWIKSFDATVSRDSSLHYRRCDLLSSTFRVDWTACEQTPSVHYVPLRRGSARRASLVHELAALPTREARIRVEAVELGTVSRVTTVHGFGHGDPRQGKRYVLQVVT